MKMHACKNLRYSKTVMSARIDILLKFINHRVVDLVENLVIRNFDVKIDFLQISYHVISSLHSALVNERKLGA